LEKVGAADSVKETVEVVATVEVAAKVAAVLVVAATAAGAAVVVGWVVEVPLVGGAEAGRAATAPHMRIGRCSMRGHDTRET
jgi:hypothetical protein